MSTGLLLGVLRVYVYGQKVKVGYFMDEPFVMDEVQNYIGEEILLHDNNGNLIHPKNEYQIFDKKSHPNKKEGLTKTG